MSDRPTLASMTSSRTAISDLGSNKLYDADGNATPGEHTPPKNLSRRASNADPKSDYEVPFKVDKEMMAPVIEKVRELLKKQGFMADAVIESELDVFFDTLGLDAWFFHEQSAEDLANYVISLATAKMISKMTQTKLNIKLNDNKSGRAVYMVPSDPGNRNSMATRLEAEVETKWLGEGYRKTDDSERLFYRLQCYRTHGTVAVDSDVRLRLYILEEPQYPDDAITDPHFITKTIDDLKKVADQSFFTVSTKRTKVIVSEMLAAAAVYRAGGTVVRGFHYPDSGEFRLLVCYKQGTTHSFLSGLTDLYHSYGITSTRKYVEQFSHGYCVYSIYLDVKDRDPNELLHLFEDLKDDASFLYVLPRTSLSPLIKDSGLSQQEHVYAYSAWKFAYHFLSRYSNEYSELAHSFTRLNSQQTHEQMQALTALGKLKLKLAKDSFTEQRFRDAILAHPEIIQRLYKDFESLHSLTESTLGASKRQRATNKNYWDTPARKELSQFIAKSVSNELDEQIFQMFVTFNQYVLKTNFYRRDKVAVSFRLDPTYLDQMDYPLTPFGVFFVVGSEFRGFHVRFRDVARGGIRVVRSRSLTAFQANLPTLFDEVYNLAATQQRKNKDIPEGGSKGVILLSTDHQDKADVAFYKYVDALLDLLLLDATKTVDYYNKEEILFLGPDEGTADFMNWASEQARIRGASFWKAFTTGKSRSRGGIPHDLYGMTTKSIHTYVLGCLTKLGLDESEVTKFQTGGPDGDLGSNEILVSKDKTIGIVDGGGVLFDPNGINREELIRLAKERKLSRHFDRSKLSKDGFYVDVEHLDLSQSSDLSSPNLPKAITEAFPSGVTVRNAFHVNHLAASTLFVPCGGRPRAIDSSNVDQLMIEGKPMFNVVVEGANLFFTQEARLRLEEEGVVLYKDASANKGGVTSSSLEVFAALALTDDEFKEHMSVVSDDNVPAFYEAYVKDVLMIIERNAQAEFDCLWREHERTGKPRCILSDLVSFKINEMVDSIGSSSLWTQDAVKHNVLLQACPPALVKLLGLKTILERVPEQYTQAIFASYLASRFVYRFGLDASDFAFFEFVQPLLEPVDASHLEPVKK